MPGPFELLIIIFLIPAIIFIFFVQVLILRWVFRINTIVNLLEQIRNNTNKESFENLEPLEEGKWKCQCSHINLSSDELCVKCGRSPDAII